jgi:hypothetical protein
VPLTDSQVGMIGEHLLCAHLVHGSDGALDVFRPSVDDDHRDLAVGRRGAVRTAYVQVKTSRGPDAKGRILAAARWPKGSVYEHPAYLYAVVVVSGVAIVSSWLVPSADFNRLAYHEMAGPRHVRLIMQAYLEREDRWAPFRLPPEQLGADLLGRLDNLAASNLLLTLPPRGAESMGG